MASKLRDDFDETQFRDEDLDDPELEREMRELEQEERKEQAEQLQTRLDESKERALSLKAQGRIEEAKTEMREIMAIKKELDDLKAEIAAAEPKPAVLDLDSDDEGFDYASVVSMSVMEYELGKAKQRRDVDVTATLELKISLLTTNINMNLVSMDKYAEDISHKVRQTKQLLAQATPAQRAVLQKHIELMQTELKHLEQEDSDEAEQAEDDPVFDYGSICSMAVLEAELEKASKRRDAETVVTLNVKIKVLTTNIQMGLMSQEQYIQAVNHKVTEYRGLVNSVPAGLKATYQQHIKLMEDELSQQDNEDESDEEEGQAPPPPAKEQGRAQLVQEVPEISHETLIGSNSTYRELYETMEELKLAINYLKDLGHLEPIEGLLTKAERLHKQLSCIRRAQPFTLDLVSLLPSDITGMTETERRQRAVQLAEKAGQLEEEFKQAALDALKAKDRDNAARQKSLMLQYQQLQKDLIGSQQNPWQLLPTLVQEQRVERKEKLNEDVREGVLEVTVGKMDGASDSDELYVYLHLGLSKNLTLRGSTKQTKQAKTRGFNYTHCFEVDAKEWGMLDRRRLTLELYKHRWVRSDKLLGNGVVKLSDLCSTCSVQTSAPIGGRKGPGLEITLRVRRAFKANELVEVKSYTDTIRPMPPPFKQVNGSLAYHRRPEPQVSQASLSVSQPNMSAHTMSQPARPVSLAVAEESKVAVAKMTDAQLADLYPLDDIYCVGVLEQEVVRISALIKEKRNQGENVADFQRQQQQTIRKKELLKGQIENGVVTVSQYLQALEGQNAGDMERAKAFKTRGDTAAFGVVMQRLKMTQKEIAEIKRNA
jgi:hypothetical protein